MTIQIWNTGEDWHVVLLGENSEVIDSSCAVTTVDVRIVAADMLRAAFGDAPALAFTPPF